MWRGVPARGRAGVRELHREASAWPGGRDDPGPPGATACSRGACRPGLDDLDPGGPIPSQAAAALPRCLQSQRAKGVSMTKAVSSKR